MCMCMCRSACACVRGTQRAHEHVCVHASVCRRTPYCIDIEYTIRKTTGSCATVLIWQVSVPAVGRTSISPTSVLRVVAREEEAAGSSVTCRDGRPLCVPCAGDANTDDMATHATIPRGDGVSGEHQPAAEVGEALSRAQDLSCSFEVGQQRSLDPNSHTCASTRNITARADGK